MGVYETRLLKQHHSVMHWEHSERFFGPAYDSPRELSPNLPPLCDNISSMNIKEDAQNLNLNLNLNQNNNNSTIIGRNLHNNNSINNNSNICPSSCTPAMLTTSTAGTHIHSTSFDLVQTTKVEPQSPPQFYQRQQLLNAPNICAGCNQKIVDRYYLETVDRRWHINCLLCYQCRMPLNGEATCFSRDGNIYCKKDYQKMKRCSRCQLEIPSTDLVMRAREFVFHIRCFSCFVCRSPLTTGDQFGLRDGAVLCHLHYEISLSDSMNSDVYRMQKHETNCQPAFPSPDFNQHLVPLLPIPNHSEPHGTASSKSLNNNENLAAKFNFFNGTSNMDAYQTNSPPTPSTTPRQKGRPRKRKPKDLDSMHNNLDINSDYLDLGSFGRSPLDDGCDSNMSGMHGSNSRTKRMRTSFKHHQLRTMKSYFSINHNPDAKDLKQLAQKTGLQKRVLQVWFQNARAKWRRMVMKQDGKSPLHNSDKCSGPSSDTSNLSELDIYGPSSLTSSSLQSLNPHSPPFLLPEASPPL